MLRITRLTDYATVVMTHLARQPECVVSASELAQQAHLEPATTSKLLKTLGRAGLVESYRGASGGYCLARAPVDISLADIVEAMEGPFGMTECSVAAGECALEAHCVVRSGWQQISQVVERALRSMSLADILAPVQSSVSQQPVHRS